MAEPKLRVAASGFGGSGYKNPFTGEKVPGVTTALSHLEKKGILQWSIDQVSAYAAVNAESLIERTYEQGFKFLRFYHSRMKSSDFDDPYVDLRNSASGVLNDLAELGTTVHDWIEADLLDLLEPEIVRREQEEMVIAYLEWKADQDIEVRLTEATVFGDGYGGTLDWHLKLNGVETLGDTKTSRATRREHYAQLAALGAADTLAREVPKGTEGAEEYTATKAGKKSTSYWVPDVIPPFSRYGILHLRPNDYDAQGNFVPAFCEFKPVSQEKIEAGFRLFRASLAACNAGAEFKALEKEEQ